jgi:hypothetical protein
MVFQEVDGERKRWGHPIMFLSRGKTKNFQKILPS